MSKFSKKIKIDNNLRSPITDYDEDEIISSANYNSINQTIQIYKFNENTQDKEADDHSIITNNNSNTVFNNNENNKIDNRTIVPTLSNVEDIFQFLSQKIAKYCQVLADLTNCEVFYKAQLPLNKDLNSNKIKSKDSNRKSYSLYWGTNRMLFQYSHGKGLKLSKENGDCLVRINQRSFSNDVNNLIEEIVNEPNLANKFSSTKKFTSKFEESKNIYSNKSSHDDLFEDSDNDNEINIKDCSILLSRLDENDFERHLNNFEISNNRINLSTNKHEYFHELNLPEEDELYCDDFHLNFEGKLDKFNRNVALDDTLSSNNMDEEFESKNEKNLSKKYLLDYKSNNDQIFRCETCESCYFRHLTQLKVHELRVHQNVSIEQINNSCPKCKNKFDGNYISFIKHLIECYYPDLYVCKTCKYKFNNYSEYLFHIKYIHTNLVYMCSICGRKFKVLKDLFDHDQLMHSKNNLYCEICLDHIKTKNCLYEHYKSEHLRKKQKLNTSKDMVKILDSTDSDSYHSTNQFNISFLKNTNHPEEQNEFEDGQINNESEIENINQNNIINNNIQKNDLIRGLIDRKHQCKWCMLRFYTKSQLKQHEITHTNSVLYCPICDKEFTHKDRLSGHMKCHMEPSLECKVCGKKFKRLCNLYNHELVHGLTEHAFMLCQFCGRGFRSRRDYQNHVIANHRDQLIKTDSLDSNQKEHYH